MKKRLILQLILATLAIPVASGQTGPIIYLPSAQFPGSEITSQGTLSLTGELPGDLFVSEDVDLLRANAITASDTLGLSYAESFAVNYQDSGSTSAPRECMFTGTVVFGSLGGSPGPGFGYSVLGTTDLINVRTHSNYNVQATVGSNPVDDSGGGSAESKATLSTSAPMQVSVPFAVRLPGFRASVFTQRTFLARGIGNLDGSSELEWRVAEDIDGDGKVSPGDLVIFESMPPLFLNTPTGMVNGVAATSPLLAVGRYVLEVTYDHTQEASVSVGCDKEFSQFVSQNGLDRSFGQVTLTFE